MGPPMTMVMWPSMRTIAKIEEKKLMYASLIMSDTAHPKFSEHSEISESVSRVGGNKK